MKKVIIALVGLSASFAFASPEKKEFSAKGLKTLELMNSSGNAKISVSEDGKAYVTADKVQFEKNCDLTIDRSGDELIVQVQKRGWYGSDHCKVNFEIEVPKEIALDLQSGSGDVVVNGTKGNVDFKLGSGDAKITADVKKLIGKSGSGSVEVSGLNGNAAIISGTGNITLSYASLAKGSLNIKSGSGSATVYFPPSMKISTDFKSGTGRAYNEMEDSPDASFKVSMKAGTGDLKIKKLQ